MIRRVLPRPFPGIHPFASAFWSVFAVLSCSQWYAVFYLNKHDDFVGLLLLYLFWSIPAGLLLHGILTIVLGLRFGLRDGRAAVTAADLLSPLLVLFPFSLVFYHTGAARTFRFEIILPALLFAAYLFRFLIIKVAPPEPLEQDHPRSFANPLRFYISGLAELADSILLPRIFKGTLAPPFVWPLLLACGALVLRFGNSIAYSIPGFLLLCATTAVSVWLAVRMVYDLADRSPRGLALGLSILLACYGLLVFYHWKSGAPLDLSLIIQNRDILFDPSSILVYLGRLNPGTAVAALGVALFLVMFQIRHAVFTSVRPVRPRGIWVLLFLAWNAGLLFVRLPSLDPLQPPLRSLVSAGRTQSAMKAIERKSGDGFPYLRQHAVLTHSRPGQAPDIFVVLMESFSETLVETPPVNGKSVTPVFDSLIPKGIYAEIFYGNTVQTARALFTIFAGTPESIREKAFLSYTGVSVQGLPRILSRHGYRTIFFNAHKSLSFDNKGPSLKRLGFDDVIPMAGPVVADVPREFFWNWGIRDDVFFRKSFGQLDVMTSSPADRKPVFAVWLTLTHHNPHNRVPKNLKEIYPEAGPRDAAKNFVDSQHLADRYLAEFFRQLASRPRYRDAIVILMSDHGFPGGKHSVFNEIGFYEENFRIPFLLIAPGLAPRRIKGVAYDQLDFAPTVMDLAGIDAPNHFIGRSILGPATNKPIALCQPYNGLFLIGVNYPWKYVRSVRADREMLFNLADDPDERIDRSLLPGMSARLREGRRTADSLLLHQILLDRNRIWPPDQP